MQTCCFYVQFSCFLALIPVWLTHVMYITQAANTTVNFISANVSVHALRAALKF